MLRIIKRTFSSAKLLTHLQVPNQPIIFDDEPFPDFYPKGRSEDGIIAYGWAK